MSAAAIPTDSGPEPDLARENAYLRQRNAQLQDDLVSLQAEAGRLRQMVERLHGRTPAAAPDPLSGLRGGGQ